MTGVAVHESWMPTTSEITRRLRAEVYRAIREFFSQRDVLEVETPQLSRHANSDPNIESLAVTGCDRRYYLRTSAEFPMKRLLAAEGKAIYELGRVFRAAEVGAMHNPEFTMLEWYRPGMDHHQLMVEVVALVQGLFARFAQPITVSKLSYAQAVESSCGLNPLHASDDALAAWARDRAGAHTRFSRSQCLDLMLSLVVAPSFPPRHATLIYDFPACQAALARVSEADPRVAERFELFIGAVELANGYNELCDPVALRQRLNEENDRRRRGQQEVLPLDEELMDAVAHGIGPCAGVALGVDRLLAVLVGAQSLAEVVNFPIDRA